MEKNGKKLIWALVVLGLCLLLIAGLIKFGNVLAFLMVFPWVVDQLVKIGFDIWLARLITVPIACIMVIGFGMAFSLSESKRRSGLALFAVGVMIWSAAMYYMSKDYVFDPVSGTVKKCYAATPNGYEMVSCAWKVHPVYGSAVKPATKEMLTADWVAKHGLPPLRMIEPSRNLSYFAPDGSSLVWYHENPDGKMELFSGPGKHPHLNVELKPVDARTVQKIFAYMDNVERQAKMAAEKKETELREKNLITNGDFSRQLEGWSKSIGDVTKGHSQSDIVPFNQSRAGKALQLAHRGEGHVQYSQIVPVASPDVIFQVSFRPRVREGNMTGFSGSGVAQVGLVYMDSEGQRMGETILVSYVKNPFADTALVGVPRRESDSNTKHFIELAGEKFYENYQLDVRNELENNLMGIKPDDVKKIAIVLWCGASHEQAAAQLLVADLRLEKK